MNPSPKKLVVEYVLSHPGSSRAEVFQALDDRVSFQSCSQALLKAVEQGYLEHRRGRESTSGRERDLFYPTPKAQSPIQVNVKIAATARPCQITGFGTLPPDSPIFDLQQAVQRMVKGGG